MIVIAEERQDVESLLRRRPWHRVQREMIDRMVTSQAVFAYPSFEEFQFELELRYQIVQSAKALHESGAAFALFERTKCNEQYWDLTEYGGCQLKEGIQPSVAIQDLFENGRKYAYECSTAMVIVWYHAILQTLGPQPFNQLFANTLLYDWQFDKDLGVKVENAEVILPGDVVYFDNPDHDPRMPEWRGENAVYLGRGLYYGHGVGISDAEEMISFLNGVRARGATRSAYLMDQVARPDFAYLSRFRALRTGTDYRQVKTGRIIAQIGSTYLEL
jgi:protein-glutamine gamma-glutamyltransferase